MNKIVLILGIGGQDGFYLTELLHSKGYEIWGVLRPEDLSTETLSGLQGKATLLQGNICDKAFMTRVLSEIKPNEIYNLASISFIPLSWEQPALVGEVNGSAVGQLLELIRTNSPRTRFFQAGSSEMFGHNPIESPQNEQTSFNPDNPYASAKVFAANLVANYRIKYNLFACTGILYNHESPKRGVDFVSRKITLAAASIHLGLQSELFLGDLASARDWSYAGDIVQAMWLMLQKDEPVDFVVGSGILHTITDMLDIAFSHFSLNWKDYVKTNVKFIRPPETRPLLADPSFARNHLHWKPEVDFEHLITMMITEDLDRMK
ncbi:MAG: GDP-mannose 4,6-dehydratase [Desulfobacterales bacterium]|nr:GDP-mannose 4,6-dehydratase [Desulfobacterales bacterium]